MWIRRYQRHNSNSLLITDRTIYRPGQTLYFKAVCLKKVGKKVDADREVEIYFRSDDNNRKKIDSLMLVTYAFGSVDGSFTLPANLEPGNYSILLLIKHSRNWQIKQFRVEEYRRPTFELTMDTIQDAYTLGDTVNLWGKAIYYSGLPVPGASARVTISGLTNEWYANTNPAGYFHVAIPTALLSAEANKDNWSQVTAYIVVSEPNGETQTVQKTFAIGGNSLTLKINKKAEHVNTAMSRQLPVTISLTNQDGATVPDTFHVSVCRLDVPARQHFAFAHNKPSLPLYSPADYQRIFPAYSFDESECLPEKFKALCPVWERTTTDTTISVNVQNWETGLYEMVVRTTDPHGKMVQDSTLFSIIGKGPFKQTTNIYTAIFDDIDSAFKESGMLHYCIGSSTIPNANVYYHISYDDKIVKQGRLVLTDTLLTDSVFVEIPKKSIRGKAEITAYTFYHNHLYQSNDRKKGYYDDALLKSLEKDSQAPLQIQVEHLNDKLNPSTQESWSFVITGKDSTQHPDAEMLAMLYDASLDPLTKKYWFLERDFSQIDNNASFISKDLKKRKYLPLFKDKSRVFVMPNLLKDDQYHKKNDKKLPKLRLWNAQLPSARLFTSDFKCVALSLQSGKRGLYPFFERHNARQAVLLRHLPHRFLYALSYYADWQEEWLPQAQLDFYLEQAETQYVTSDLREKAQIALACHRLGHTESAAQWAEALRQQAHKDAYGLSWTELGDHQRGWRDVAVKTEALLMELFYEVLPDTTDAQRNLKAQTLDGIAQWLLAQRTTNHWGSNATTTAVCYALALQENNNNRPANNQVNDIIIRYGDTIFHHPDTLLCGQYELSGSINTPVIIENHSADAVYGSVWMQCQQNLDSVANYGSQEMSIRRTLYRRNYLDGNGGWKAIVTGDTLHVGDILTVRFVIENARDMDYVNISDMRACAFEPMSQSSQWKSNGDLRWYESPRDHTTEFYITHLNRGTHVVEYQLKVTQAGTFRNGTATIESMQALEFTAHSDSPKVKVEKSESGKN